jgi:hypothetical protein
MSGSSPSRFRVHNRSHHNPRSTRTSACSNDSRERMRGRRWWGGSLIAVAGPAPGSRTSSSRRTCGRSAATPSLPPRRELARRRERLPRSDPAPAVPPHDTGAAHPPGYILAWPSAVVPPRYVPRSPDLVVHHRRGTVVCRHQWRCDRRSPRRPRRGYRCGTRTWFCDSVVMSRRSSCSLRRSRSWSPRFARRPTIGLAIGLGVRSELRPDAPNRSSSSPAHRAARLLAPRGRLRRRLALRRIAATLVTIAPGSAITSCASSILPSVSTSS